MLYADGVDLNAAARLPLMSEFKKILKPCHFLSFPARPSPDRRSVGPARGAARVKDFFKMGAARKL